MKQLLLTLCLVFGAASLTKGQSSQLINRSDYKNGREILMNRKEAKNLRNRLGNLAEEHSMSSSGSFVSAVANSSPALIATPPLTPKDLNEELSVSGSCGTVYFLDKTAGEDPSQFYTKKITTNATYNYVYESAEFAFYDKKLEKKHTITLDLTPYPGCNDIQIGRQYSRQFFNTATTAPLIYLFMIHYFAPPGGPENEKYAYLIVNQSGEILRILDNVIGVYMFYNSSSGKLIIDNFAHNQTDYQYDVYNARSFLTTATPAKQATHTYSADKTNNIGGPPLDFKKIDNVDYYYFTSYEKPFWKTKNPTWEVEEGNQFILDLFKCSNSAAYKSIHLPIVGFKQECASSAVFGMSFQDYEITSKVFNTDAKLEIIYAIDHYYSSCDCSKQKYYLANEDGVLLDSIPLPLEGEAKKLNELKGFESQYALYEKQGDGVSAIHFFDLPSWSLKNTFPARVNGELLSLGFERTLIGENQYAYVFLLSDPFKDKGNVYSKVNWYYPDGILYKDVKFNLGSKGIYFQTLISPATLNPYLFNTDDKMEYIGFAQLYNNSGKSYYSMRIYNEDGDLLFQADDDAIKGSIRAGLYTVSNGKSWEYLQIGYSKNSVLDYTFYTLPLTSFGGGNGTVENPYIIRSAGDFDLIRNKPQASYVFANDIDMQNILSTKYASSGWMPIPGFKGQIDGKGYSVHHFKLDNNSGDAALIGDMSYLTASQTWIKNLNLVDAEITPASNTNIGFLVGKMSGSASDSVFIRNCHVTGNILQKDVFPSSGNIGGIVGQASVYAGVIASSFTGSIRSKEGGQALSPKIGGIIGNAQTGGYAQACYSAGDITIENGNTTSLGGIIGRVHNDVVIKNSYSTMNLKGGTDVGGIAGTFTATASNKGFIENCYATGNIVAAKASGNYFAGGIIGSTDSNYGNATGSFPNYTPNKTKLNMSGLIAMNDSVTALYANRIAGKTTYGLEDEAAFGVATFDSIRYCYALPALKVGKAGEEAAITSTDANSLNGADITAEELTETFYQNIGWSFGETAESPWVWNENGKPRLWFEYWVKGIQISQSSAHIDVRETLQLSVVILPVDAKNQNVTWSSSDPAIVSVDENGLITALKFGTAIITATSEESGFTATCEVKAGIAESITLNRHELNLIKIQAEEETLTAEILPQTATYTELTWTSSDTQVATVYNTGKVKAVGAGKCSIIVKLNNSDLSDTCKVTVTILGAIDFVETKDISVVQTKDQLEITSLNPLENVSIFDAGGKVVYAASGKSNKTTVSTRNWNKGVYILKMTGATKVSYRKLIVGQ